MVYTVTELPSSVIDDTLGIKQNNWDEPDHLISGQTAMEQLFKTVALETGGSAVSLQTAEQSLDVLSLQFDDPLLPGRRLDGDQLLNRRIFNDGLLVMHRGQVVHESYRNGMTHEDRHVIHSCTKSLCSMLVLRAVTSGLMSVENAISDYVPAFAGRPEWQGVTLQHVLDMQSGIDYSENYEDPNAHYWHYARAAGYYPPLEGEQAIGVKAWVVENLNKRVCEPGTGFSYNSCLTNVLGMALEAVHGQPLAEIFEQQLYQKVGAEAAGYFNTDPFGFPITEGQLSLRLRDFARCASLVMRDGQALSGEQVLPSGFFHSLVEPDADAQRAYQAITTDRIFPTGQYKHQFWVLEPEHKRLAMLGIHGQFAWYDLNLDLMMVGVGSYPKQDGLLLMRSLKALWQGVADAVK